MKNAKKLLGILLALSMCVSLLAACGGDSTGDSGSNDVGGNTADPTPAPTPAPIIEEEPEAPPPEVVENLMEKYGMDENRRYLEPVTISVLIWDRDPDNPPPGNMENAWADYIKEGMLRDHNVIIEWVSNVRRWSDAEDEQLVLTEGSAADAMQGYNMNRVNDFASQGAIVNLEPYLYQSNDLYPNLWDLVGWDLLYNNQDPETGELFAILGRDVSATKYVTYIREDWLNKLGLPLPTNHQEFEDCLVAFKENASTLLGADAGFIVPFYTSSDLGWDLAPLIESFIPDSITDKEWYVHSQGDGSRHFFKPGAKEAIRLVNKWFNMGLMDSDFALYKAGSDLGGNTIKAGWVGSLMSNLDMPYRGGADSWTLQMQATLGDESANFVAVNAFPNDAGAYRKYFGTANDRTLFIPATCQNPEAVLLYWDWLCRPDNLEYLQIGQEGENYVFTDDGGIELMLTSPGDYYHLFSAGNDYLPIIKGYRLTDPDLTGLFNANRFAGIDPRLIGAAYNVQYTDVRVMGSPKLPTIMAEQRMASEIQSQSESAWAKAIVASPDQFDSVYDTEMQVLYDNFANDSIAERTAQWEDAYGDALNLDELN